MNKFFRIGLLFSVVALLGSVSVHAVGSGVDVSQDEAGAAFSDTMTETVVTEDDKTIIVNVTVPSASASSAGDVDASAVVEAEVVPSDEPVYSAYAVTALNDAVQESPDMLSAVVSDLFGVYTPRTQTVTEYLSDGSTVTYEEVVPGLAGLDWAWLAGVGLFGLSLWSLFLLIGGVLKRG